MIYHFVVGTDASTALQKAISQCTEMAGEVVTLHDNLQSGFIQKSPGESFHLLRLAWWQRLLPQETEPSQANDLSEVLKISNELNKAGNRDIWFWMAPNIADLCAWYWLLTHLNRHIGRVFLVNVSQLPFLDENGKVFYPKTIVEILPKELVKARRLARKIQISEWESAIESWDSLVAENAGLRILEGDKKIISKPFNFFDAELVRLLSPNFQKASKVLSMAINKLTFGIGEPFLAWRLRELIAVGAIQSKNNQVKSLRDWEIRLTDNSSDGIANSQTLTLEDAV